MTSDDKMEFHNLNQKNKPKIKFKLDKNDNKDIKKTIKKQKWFSKLKSANFSRRNSKKLDLLVDFNLEGLGTIEFAKLHRDANRPLKKIKEFDDKVEFCPCCSLPKKQKGYLEEFHFNDNPDEFKICGTGIPLYFSFFRFCLIILLLASILISLPTSILTNHYTNQIIEYCYKISAKIEINNNTFPECINFIGTDGKPEYSINGSDWALRFNSINLKQYKLLHNHFTNTDTFQSEKAIYDYNFLSFLCLVTLFIINLFYIILIFNINKRNDMLVTTPGDYTAMISNLYRAFEIFLNKINRINKITEHIGSSQEIRLNEGEDKSKEKNSFTSNKYYIKGKEIYDLGLSEFPQDKKINILEGFNTFIKNRICISTEGEKYNVSQINICYKIDELKRTEDIIQDKKAKILKINNDPKQKLKNEKLNLKEQERRYFYYLISLYGINIFQLGRCKSIKLSDLEKDQSKLENKIDNLFEQSKDLTKDNFTGVIFVTFNTKKDKETFLKSYPENFLMFLLISFLNLRYYFCGCFIHKSKKKRFFLKRNMTAESAAEPEEIQFENLQISSYRRFFRTLLIYLLSIIIIGISYFFISFLNRLQKTIKYENSNYNLTVKYGISLAITIVISIINIIFEFCLEYLTKLEKHITMTNYYLSFSIKLTLFTFINSTIIPMVSNYLNYNRDYDLLVTNMFIMFLSNSFVSPILWTINFTYLIKKFIQFIIERKKIHYYTQKELNNLYELPDMKISYKYSYLAKTLLMSFFYIPIFPLGIIISLAGLFFGYHLEKYNFVNMYKRPQMLNSNLCKFYSNYFVFNFFMLGLGNYFFIGDVYDNDRWCMVNLNAFAVLLIIPYNQFMTYDFIGIKESELKNAKNYDEEYFNFYNDYERSNPMTKKEGMKRFIFKIKEKGYISTIDEAIFQSINNINLMEVYYKTKKNFNNSLVQRALSKKKQNDYKSILKQFAKGNIFKNWILKNDKEPETTEKKESLTDEENIKSSENYTEDIKSIKNLNIKIILDSYIRNSNRIKNRNDNSNNNDIYDESINNTMKSTSRKYYKNGHNFLSNINNKIISKNSINKENGRIDEENEGRNNSLINNDDNNEININNNIILDFGGKLEQDNSYDKSYNFQDQKNNSNQNYSLFSIMGLYNWIRNIFKSKNESIKEGE